MKKLIPFILLACSCGSEPKKPYVPGEKIKEIESKAITDCYINTAGTSDQDTNRVTLTIKGNNVNGDMQYSPAEKDGRRGTIYGTIEGDIIKARWIYVQEGITDSVDIEFKRKGERLLQRTSISGKEAKENVPDMMEYDLVYQKVDCD